MNDPYHVYMDLDVINNDYNSTSKPQLRFEETRNTPFLPGDSADYFCSIVRFNVQTGNTLPVFIPRIQTGQNDPCKTIYTVSFEYMFGSQLCTGSANVMYEPEDMTAPLPPPPITSQDLSTNYYNVYNYQHFILLVNQAIVAAWANLYLDIKQKSSQAYWDSLVGISIIPFIEWDTSTNRILITADQKLFDKALSTPISLLFNERLYELFAGTPSRFGQFNAGPMYQIRFADRIYNRAKTEVPYPIIGKPDNKVCQYAHSVSGDDKHRIVEPSCLHRFCFQFATHHPHPNVGPKRRRESKQ